MKRLAMAPTPSAEAVHVVDQVEGVDDGHEPGERQQQVERCRPGPHYRAAAHERQAPYGNLTSELRGRLDPQDIVDHTEEAGAATGNQERCELTP
jgi:hypothetical protein